MELKEAIGAIVAGIVLMVPAVKWLINDWANKSKEVERLKTKSNERTLDEFREQVRTFRISVSNISEAINDLRTAMAVTKSEMLSLKEKLAATEKYIDQYSKDIDSKIGNRIKTELIELSQRAALLRDKKDGNG